MVKTGVNSGDWKQLTDEVSLKVSSISALDSLQFDAEDVTAFSAFNDVIASFNDTMSQLKTYTVSDSQKMQQVAAHKLEDDQVEAASIRSKME